MHSIPGLMFINTLRERCPRNNDFISSAFTPQLALEKSSPVDAICQVDDTFVLDSKEVNKKYLEQAFTTSTDSTISKRFLDRNPDAWVEKNMIRFPIIGFAGNKDKTRVITYDWGSLRLTTPEMYVLPNGALDHRMLYALAYLWDIDQKRPDTGVVHFNWTSLGRLLGYTHIGGKDILEMKEALRRLRHMTIQATGLFHDYKNNRKIEAERHLSILSDLAFYEESSNGASQKRNAWNYNIIRFGDFFLDNMIARYCVQINVVSALRLKTDRALAMLEIIRAYRNDRAHLEYGLEKLSRDIGLPDYCDTFRNFERRMKTALSQLQKNGFIRGHEYLPKVGAGGALSEKNRWRLEEVKLKLYFEEPPPVLPSISQLLDSEPQNEFSPPPREDTWDKLHLFLMHKSKYNDPGSVAQILRQYEDKLYEVFEACLALHFTDQKERNEGKGGIKYPIKWITGALGRGIGLSALRKNPDIYREIRVCEKYTILPTSMKFRDLANREETLKQL
ncbi:MAG: hypothetical protein HQK66_11995 [Desulfamplus sp.]|nr:hypothetical protein [Desulfamplus sp.]